MARESTETQRDDNGEEIQRRPLFGPIVDQPNLESDHIYPSETCSLSGQGMRERKTRKQFPRSGELPTQSSKYWAKEKDRYLRQLLISDIEDENRA